MADLSATIRLRPARIALLVRPNDLKSIKRFMRISTCMWGGIFNPIIPIFRTPPKEWGRAYKSQITGYGIAKGYIDFFEPDAFVLAEPGLLKAAGLEALASDQTGFDRRVLSLDALLKPQDHRDWSELFFGQTMLDVFKDVYQKEQRFVLRDPRSACIVSPQRGTCLTEAMFGCYPTEKSEVYFSEWFEHVYKPEKLRPEPATWRKMVSGAVTPLGATRHSIDLERSWDNEPIIFVFDPKRTTDIIDLWNMRLEPNPVLPISIDWVSELASDVAEILMNEHRPLQGNPNGVMRHATIELSRSISQQQADTIVDLLKSALPKPAKAEKGIGPLVVKPWRNAVWERHDNALMRSPKRMKLTVTEQRHSIDLSSDGKLRTEFQTLSPEFAEQYGGHDLRWVNSLQVSAYGRERIATILPFNIMDRSWPRISLGSEPVLIGTEGWSFSQRYKRASQYIEFMSPEDALIGFLERQDVKATLSEPGHIAKQILENVRGLWGVNLFSDSETLKLLNTMVGGIRKRGAKFSKDEIEELFDRRSKPVKEWTDLISRRRSKRRGANVTLEMYTDRNVLRLGIETNCPHCKTSNWHGIDTANYNLICERCLKNYSFPQAELRRDNKNWAYRVVGPFSVPDYARGSYSALLAINTINQVSSATFPNSMTFSTALSMSFDGKVREADFVALYSDSKFDGSTEPY